MRSWTHQMEEQLRKLYPSTQTWRVAEIMGISRERVKWRAAFLGLRKAKGYRPITVNSPWKDVSDEEFIKLYPDTPNSVLAKQWGVSVSAVKNRSVKLDVIKSTSFMKNNSGRFEKGLTPHNKGKKMSAELRDKVKHTWFPKGHKPHNTKHDGLVTIRADKRGVEYLFMRISEGVWEPLHRVIWENEHGKIPKGYNLIFKDGNTKNCKLENLELLSNGELMKRNSGVINVSDSYVAALLTVRNKPLRKAILGRSDIIEAKRLAIKLNRLIYKKDESDTKTKEN